MNFIHFFNNSTANENILPREQIRLKQNLYGFTDQLIFNKLAFAYFIDHIKQAKLKAQEPKSLTKYEWCAGSLTAEQFSIQLIFFLTSPKADTLPRWIKQTIKTFTSTLDASNDQGYLIDQARSEDLGLIFFIATGWYIGTPLNSNLETIQTLARHTLKKINRLQEGEELILLLGSAIHETCMTIKRKNNTWTVYYFNSNKKEFSNYLCKKADQLFKSAFWENIYNFKFTPEDFKDETGQKKTVSKELKKHIHTIGMRNSFKNQRYYAAQMKVQGKNTCHFKSLWAALKKEVFYSVGIDVPTATLAWSQFKHSFGEYLLEHPELDENIKFIAKAKQTTRAECAEIFTVISEILTRDHYYESVAKIVKLIKRLDPSNKIRPKDFTSQSKNLKLLNRCLLNLLNSYIGDPNTIRSIINEMADPLINFTYKKYENNLLTKQKETAAILKNEENLQISNLDYVVDTVKEKLPFIYTQEIKECDYAPLETKQLEKYLGLFNHYPNLLLHLKYRPATICVLLQAIQWGKIKIVQTIYSKLDPSDAQILDQAIGKFCIPTKELKSLHLFLPMWNVTLDDFNLRNGQPDNFSKLFLDSLINKARMESSLRNYFRLVDLKLSSISNASDSSDDTTLKLTSSIKFTKPDIEQFIHQVNEEKDNKKTEMIIQSSYFADILPELARTIIDSGWYELLELIPLSIATKLKPCNFVLSKKTTEELEELYKSSHQNVLHSFFARNIVLNKYKLGMFKDLICEKKIMLTENFNDITNEYAFSFDEQTFYSGLELLKNCQSAPFLNRCLIDLITYTSTEDSLRELLLYTIFTKLEQHEPMKLLSAALVNSLDYFISQRNNSVNELFKILWDKILLAQYNINIQPLFEENSLTRFMFKDINDSNFEKIQKNMVSFLQKGYAFHYEELAKIIGIDDLVIKFPYAPLSLRMGIYLLKNLEKAISKNDPRLNQELKQGYVDRFNKLYKAILDSYPQYSNPEEKGKLSQEIWGHF